MKPELNQYKQEPDLFWQNTWLMGDGYDVMEAALDYDTHADRRDHYLSRLIGEIRYELNLALLSGSIRNLYETFGWEFCTRRLENRRLWT